MEFLKVPYLVLCIFSYISMTCPQPSTYDLNPYCVGFGVLTAVVMKSTILWDIVPCSLLSQPAGFLLSLLFYNPEDGGDMLLQNVG
jgi:hypothetical protein